MGWKSSNFFKQMVLGTQVKVIFFLENYFYIYVHQCCVNWYMAENGSWTDVCLSTLFQRSNEVAFSTGRFLQIRAHICNSSETLNYMQTLPHTSFKINDLYQIQITLVDIQARAYNLMIMGISRGFNIFTRKNKDDKERRWHTNWLDW